jgi:prepilin-type N-terminal cleavage/methylation domain-containing protein
MTASLRYTRFPHHHDPASRMPVCPAGPGTRRGFTSLELLVVITIVSIVAAIAINQVDLYRMQANAGVQAISTTMIAAQRESITRQHDIILTFDAFARTMRMTWDVDNDGTIDGGERSRAIPLDGRVAFGRGGAPARAIGANPINFSRVVNGLPALVFHRNGSASGLGGFYLTTTRALAAAAAGSDKHAADTRAVEIVRATGRTEWYRYDGSSWHRGF